MIQQTISKLRLHQKKIAFTESTSEQDFVNDARDTDASKQTIHNSQKTNVPHG